MIRQRTVFEAYRTQPVNNFTAPESPVYSELIINSEYMPRVVVKQPGSNPEGSNNG